MIACRKATNPKTRYDTFLGKAEREDPSLDLKGADFLGDISNSI